MAITPSNQFDKMNPADEEIIPFRESELDEWETNLSRIKSVEAYVPAIVGVLFGIWLATLFFALYNISIIHKIDTINCSKRYLIMSLMNSSTYNTSVHNVTGIQNGMTITEQVQLATTQPMMFVAILLGSFILTIAAYWYFYNKYREQEFGLIDHMLDQIKLAKKKHLHKK